MWLADADGETAEAGMCCADKGGADLELSGELYEDLDQDAPAPGVPTRYTPLRPPPHTSATNAAPALPKSRSTSAPAPTTIPTTPLKTPSAAPNGRGEPAALLKAVEESPCSTPKLKAKKAPLAPSGLGPVDTATTSSPVTTTTTTAPDHSTGGQGSALYGNVDKKKSPAASTPNAGPTSDPALDAHTNLHSQAYGNVVETKPTTDHSNVSKGHSSDIANSSTKSTSLEAPAYGNVDDAESERVSGLHAARLLQAKHNAAYDDDDNLEDHQMELYDNWEKPSTTS